MSLRLTYLPVRLTLFSVAILSGCANEATPDEVRQRTSSILVPMIRDVGETGKSVSSIESVRALLDGLAELGLGTDDVAKADSSSDQAAELAEHLDELLAKLIFNEKNLESQTGDSATFLLHGAVVCETEASACAGSGCDSPEPSSSKTKCVETVDKLAIRIIATLTDNGGVHLALRVGPGGSALVLRLTSNSIVLESHLAEARESVVHVAQVLEEDVPELPEVMEGVLSISLSRQAARDLTLRTSILEALNVSGTSPKGPYQLKAEARDPLAEVHLDGAAGTLTWSLDWGVIEAALPASLAFKNAPGQLELMLRGLSSKLTAGKGSTLSIQNLGFGDGASWLKLGTQTLFQMELNPDAGRKLSLEITPWQDLPRCTASPKLDLRVTLHLAPLQPYLTSEIDDWAKDERYLVQLASASGKPEVIPVRQSGSFAGGLKVLDGELRLQSLVQPAQIVVPAGSCLTSVEEPTSHSLLGHLQSTTCP